MERIDLGTIIQDSISRFSQNRIGDKPPVFVTLSPALTQVPWNDRTLKEFLRYFLYEALLTSDPDAPVEITLRRRTLLADLKAFVGVQPSYWIQVRISGRGLRIAENLVEDLFTEVGYRCEEWVGIDGSEAVAVLLRGEPFVVVRRGGVLLLLEKLVKRPLARGLQVQPHVGDFERVVDAAGVILRRRLPVDTPGEGNPAAVLDSGRDASRLGGQRHRG